MKRSRGQLKVGWSYQARQPRDEQYSDERVTRHWLSRVSKLFLDFDYVVHMEVCFPSCLFSVWSFLTRVSMLFSDFDYVLHMEVCFPSCSLSVWSFLTREREAG